MKKNNGKYIGYQMSQRMFKDILDKRITNEDLGMNPYQFAMNYINEQFGLRGTVKFISVARN